MSKTIKQIADELGVSKPTISKIISDLGLEPYKVRNRFELSDADCVAVIAKISQSDLPDEPQKSQKSQSAMPEKSQKSQSKLPDESQKSQISQSNTEKPLIAMLESQISLLQEQLSVKDDQIRTLQMQLSARDAQISQITSALESTTAALTAAQALHAADKRSQLLIEDRETQKKMSFWERRAAKKAAKKAAKAARKAQGAE